jgi:hypothetical protein
MEAVPEAASSVLESRAVGRYVFAVSDETTW